MILNQLINRVGTSHEPVRFRSTRLVDQYLARPSWFSIWLELIFTLAQLELKFCYNLFWLGSARARLFHKAFWIGSSGKFFSSIQPYLFIKWLIKQSQIFLPQRKYKMFFIANQSKNTLRKNVLDLEWNSQFLFMLYLSKFISKGE